MITEAKIEAIRFKNANNDVISDVMQFHASDWSAAEVNTKSYKNVHSAYSVYRATIKRLRVAVVPITRSGRLYLVRSDPSGSECG